MPCAYKTVPEILILGCIGSGILESVMDIGVIDAHTIVAEMLHEILVHSTRLVHKTTQVTLDLFIGDINACRKWFMDSIGLRCTIFCIRLSLLSAFLCEFRIIFRA